MDQCGLTHMRRRIVGQLSKGYRQRVGLADALVARPRLLILDEPTGGLDPHQRKEVLELIKGLAHEHTVLLSSHVLAEIESISSRVMIIQRGRLLASGKVDEPELRRRRACASRRRGAATRCSPRSRRSRASAPARPRSSSSATAGCR
jgi:ABC-2 type transport system ATP-binding protein